MAGVGSISDLISEMTRSPYREEVEAALVQYAGVEVISQALQENMVHAVTKIRRFYSGRAETLAGWVLRRYDIDNVKAILRGLMQQVPADEIITATLPVGDLQPADLAILARSANVREAIDLLVTWRIPLSQHLLALRAEKAGANLFDMEMALDKWYFDTGMKAAKRNGESLHQSLIVQADVINILTALRLVGKSEPVTFLQQHFDALDITPLFFGPGHVAFDLLVETVSQDSVNDAVETLQATIYGATLFGALDRYRVTNRLSEFEFALQRQQLRQANNLLIRDPLGIGMLIGYLAQKMNEIANLRRVVQGVFHGEQASAIRAELMVVNL